MKNLLKSILKGLTGLLMCTLLVACGSEATSAPSPPSSTAPASAAAIARLSTAPSVEVALLHTVTPLPTTPVATPTSLPATVTPTAVRPPGSTAVPKAVDNAVGELPAPPGARRLNLTLEMLQRLQKRLGQRAAGINLATLTVGAYAVPDMPVDVLDYYRGALTKKGWKESRAYDNRFGLYFAKGAQLALASATGIPDNLTVAFLAGFVPEIQGQIVGGETLVLLGQGPTRSFELLKK